MRAPVRAITYDLDGTLYDLEASMASGAAAVIAALEARPGQRARPTAERLYAIWEAVTEEARLAVEIATVDWHAVRRESIARMIAESDRRDEALADDLTAVYFEQRHAPIPAYEDALAALQSLRKRLPVGIITNANTPLAQIGMEEAHFAIVLRPSHLGVGKPNARVFHHAAGALGCTPAELLHVGDRWDDDVTGALGAGCQAAWYSPGGAPAPARPTPHLILRDHRDLLAWIDTR